MKISPLAGNPAPATLLIDPARLEREYHDRRPDPDDPRQLVSFGTSGHRGSPLQSSFNEAHILAITQAICDHRRTPSADPVQHYPPAAGGNKALALRDTTVEYHDEVLLETGTLVDHAASLSRVIRVTSAGPHGAQFSGRVSPRLEQISIFP